jgi:hypothetical protein
MTSPYVKITASKRRWTPTQVSKGILKEGAEDTLRRCLALRHLELPVRDLLDDGLARELPGTPGVVQALESNMADEERHDQALQFVVDAHGTHAKDEATGKTIRDAWVDHADHPILKAAILERSVFFVLLPFLRFAGDVGIRTTASDISRDERAHVAVHHMVASELGLKPSPSLNSLRRATVDWVFQMLPASHADQQLTKTFWLQASDNLFARGKAPELKATRSARMPAFFEASNVDLPSYS